MATLVDVENEASDVEGLEQALREAVTRDKNADDRPEDQKVREMEPSDASKDPLKGTKFEGKSLEDLIESYNNLQSAYGRMANDLGTQRKLTDQLLNLKRDDDLQSNAAPKPTVDAAQLLDDPTQALDRYISEREARIKAEYDQRLNQFETQLQADRFMQKHPDFMDLGQSEEFRKWATGNPIRNRVAQAAAQGDWDAADALLQEYKAERKKQSAAPADTASKEGLEAARKVGLESAASDGSGSSSGKIYRRADLIDLKLRKPHVYSDPAFQAEILKAYSEGRVK